MEKISAEDFCAVEEVGEEGYVVFVYCIDGTSLEVCRFTNERKANDVAGRIKMAFRSYHITVGK